MYYKFHTRKKTVVLITSSGPKGPHRTVITSL